MLKTIIMDKNKLRSQSLDLLRFPLAVVILSIHVFSTNGITFQGVTSDFESFPFFLFVNAKNGWIFAVQNTLENQKKLIKQEKIQNYKIKLL